MLLDFRNVVQKSVNDANNDFNLDSGTTGVDHTLINILGIDGVGGGGNIAQSRYLYLDFTNLPTSIDIDPAVDTIVFYDDSTGNHYQVLISDIVGTGNVDVQYISDTCTITATDTGIVVTRGAGTITVTIPTGVILKSINIRGEAADLDGSDNLFVKLINETESTINQDINSAIIPTVAFLSLVDAVDLNGGTITESFPAPYDPYKTFSIVECGPDGADAVLRLKFESIRDTNFIIKLNF